MSAADETARAAGRLALALDLYEAGEQIMRASLRRRDPGASAAEIEALLRRWLVTRPGAEHGDCTGRPRVLSPR